MGGRIKVIIILAVGVLALLTPVCGPSQDYILGEGDLLKISVYENDDLTTVSRIGGEGTVTLPLIGEVNVAGISVRAAEKKIAGLLAEGYLVNPQVSIFIQEYRSKKVTILGEINKPGLYELNGLVTLLEIISRAGGLTENAGDAAVVKRKGTNQGAGETITISLKGLMELGDVAANIQVQDGDSIFITTGGLVYVTGEVNRPGAYKVGEDTTVMKAIALAGGLTEIASPGRTVLIRKVDGEEVEMKVEMGFKVMPDDVISVPESFF